VGHAVAQPGRTASKDSRATGSRATATMGLVMASGRPLQSLSRRPADSGDLAIRSRASATRARPLAYCS
jgi:hypothetical protein